MRSNPEPNAAKPALKNLILVRSVVLIFESQECVRIALRAPSIYSTSDILSLVVKGSEQPSVRRKNPGFVVV